MRVAAPDGRIWVVERRFARPEWHAPKTGDFLDWFAFGGDFAGFADASVTAAAVVIGLIVAFGVIVFFFLPLLLFIVEGVLAVIGALLVFKPWNVVAKTED